jgi:hypothetical protein
MSPVVQRVIQLLFLLLAIVGIVSNFITVYGFVKSHRNKMKTALNNPYKKTMIVSLVLTAIFLVIFFLMGGGDFVKYYIYQPVNNSITPQKHTVKKSNTKATLDTEKTLIPMPNRASQIKKKKTLASFYEIKEKKSKNDTTNKGDTYDLKGAIVTQSAVGKGASVTNINAEKPARILNQKDAQEILTEVNKIVSDNPEFNKETKIRYWIPIQDPEANKYANQIYNYMHDSGYINFEVRYGMMSGLRDFNFEVIKEKSEDGDRVGEDIITIRIVPQNMVE